MGADNQVQETAANTPPAGDEAATPTTVSTQKQDRDDKVFDSEYVAKLRREAAAHRVEARELQEKLDSLSSQSRQERTELEKKLDETMRRMEEAENRYREASLRSEVFLAATRLRFADPELAWRLLDHDAVEVDDGGNVKNLDELLDATLEKWPFLRGSAPASTTSVMNTSRKDTVFKRSQLRDPDFFREHQQEILLAMREGRIVDDIG